MAGYPANRNRISGTSLHSTIIVRHISTNITASCSSTVFHLLYITPVIRTITQISCFCLLTDREVDLIKMKNLLNILSDSSKRCTFTFADSVWFLVITVWKMYYCDNIFRLRGEVLTMRHYTNLRLPLPLRNRTVTKPSGCWC